MPIGSKRGGGGIIKSKKGKRKVKKAKLLALFGSICLVVALVVTLSGGMALVFADKPESKLPPGIEKTVQPVEAEIPFEDGVPIVPPNTRPVLVLSGSDYDMGYQYQQQLIQIFGTWILEDYQYSSFSWTLRMSKVVHGPFTKEELAALKAYQWYINEETPEMIDFMKGMADGATDAGVELSYTEVLASFTGTSSYPGTEPSGSEKDKLPPEDCSSFVAFGSATRDGSLIFGGNGDHEMTQTEVCLMFFPETGNNFVCSTCTGGCWHPAMNNKGLAYAHHGAGVSGNYPSGYGIPSPFSTLHIMRFADDAIEAVEMQLGFTCRAKGEWADIAGNAFVIECKDPVVVREPGEHGETDFLFATNNTLSEELEEFQGVHPVHGLKYTPELGYLGVGATLSSNARNEELWNLLHNYNGEIDLEFAKMMYRFPAEPPDYPTLEEANAAYYATQGAGWHQHICDLENGMVGIGIPDDGDEGLYYVSHGCAARLTASLVPHGHFYRVAPTYAFYELKLASNPADVTEAARVRAQYQMYYANRELRQLTYLDEGYAALDEIFNQSAREWIKGERYMADAMMTTGNESINNWGKSLRAFTRAQTLANQVYNSLVLPPDCPEDLGLGEWHGPWGEWVSKP